MASAAIVGSSSRLPNLPAGFRFHPTDEELIVHYLMNQSAAVPCPVPIIAEVNIYQCNPWELPAKTVFGENEWYFFSPRDRKYPNGARPNRAAGSGYWKATGTDKAILSSAAGERVGVKKALVFYSGKPPRGTKTDWIMHEYRLTASPGAKSTTTSKPRGSSMRLDDWVLCRIYKKSNDFQLGDQEQQDGSTVEEDTLTTTTTTHNNNTNIVALASSCSPNPKSSPEDQKPFDHDQFRQTAMAMMTKSCSLTDLLNTIDCSALSQMLLLDAPAAEPDSEPHHQSPLIYPTTTTTAQTHQSLNYNNNLNSSIHVSNFPFVDASSSDNNNGLKRKRTMAMGGGGAESLDDGSNNNSCSTSKKLKLLLPSDSRSGGHYFAAGSTSSSSYYCNQQQQLADTTTSNGGVFQYSSSLLSSNPFLSHHQMLLSSHLEMQ